MLRRSHRSIPSRPSHLFMALCAAGFPLLSASLAAQWRSKEGETIEVPAGRARLEQEPGDTSRLGTFALLDQVDWSGWEELAGLLGDVHRRAGIPALAAAFVRDGQVVAEATVGVQACGSGEAVGADARFHLGSLTKSFTACVIGRLVELGKLDWDTRVDAVLSDVAMREAYRSVTVEELLQHRGGLPAYTDRRPDGHPERTYAGTPSEQRAAFLADVLQQEPVGEPGRTVLYSNAGYALLGHMAERVAGESWERLVQRFVFEPLGMTHAGFGFPERPLGHAGNGPDFQPVPLDAYPPMEAIAPAGNVHASVSDLARYALAQLAGLEGRDGFLRAATLRRLHTVAADETGAAGTAGATSAGAAGLGRYASGWIVGSDPSGEPVHRHGGTVGASYAEIRLYPARRSATIVLSTVGSGVGEALANQVTGALLKRYAPRTTGFVSARTRGPVELRPIEGGATAEDDARLWRLIARISRAINDEDRAAYRALFAPGYDLADADSMFDFMARNVLPSRGGVRAFHAPGPPLRSSGSRHSDRPLRTVTFHLENGFPGYFGFRLDDEGRIVELSLFVKDDLCPAGTDRHCAKVVKTLEELE